MTYRLHRYPVMEDPPEVKLIWYHMLEERPSPAVIVCPDTESTMVTFVPLARAVTTEELVFGAERTLTPPSALTVPVRPAASAGADRGRISIPRREKTASAKQSMRRFPARRNNMAGPPFREMKRTV